MKSTYKIPSVFLDNKPLPDSLPRIINYSTLPECSEFQDEYSLFDYPVCRRRITGSCLLTAESVEAILALVGRIENCNEIYVVLDYFSISCIANKLFLKRVLQTIAFINEAFPEIVVYLVCENQDTVDLLYHMYAASDQ